MISIGLPAYKEPFLEEAIASVLNQSFKDFELIIVNDNSPHDIDKIVQSFNDKRIRYYKNPENLGRYSIVKNWNRCLELAQGEYFVLFSDDDIYEPDFLKELLKLAEKYNEVDLFHSRVRQIDKNGDMITFSPVCPEYEDIADFIWHRIKGYRIQYVTDFLCRTSALKSIGGFYELPLAWGSDDITWFMMAQKKGVVYSSKVLCNWRWSDINISSVGDISKRISASTMYYDFIESFVQDLIPSDENKNILGDILKNISLKKESSISDLITCNLKNLSFLKLVKYKIKYRLSLFVILKVLLKKV